MTRGPDKQFDRDEALNRAKTLFWSQGYEATGVADLLQTMKIGRQSLYDTFGSKRELFLEALHSYFGEQMKTVRGILEGPGTTVEKLEAVFQNREQMATLGPRGCLFGNAAAELGIQDPEVAQAVKSYIEAFKAGFTEVLRAGQEAGEIRKDVSPEVLASAVVVSVQGAALLSKIEPDMETSRAAFRGTLEFLRPA